MVLEMTKKFGQIHSRYNVVDSLNMRISCSLKSTTNVSVTDYLIHGDRAGIQEGLVNYRHGTSVTLLSAHIRTCTKSRAQ